MAVSKIEIDTVQIKYALDNFKSGQLSLGGHDGIGTSGWLARTATIFDILDNPEGYEALIEEAKKTGLIDY